MAQQNQDYPDATALADELSCGKTTCRKLVEEALARIEKSDRTGPALHAVLEINPDALKIADQLDNERKQGKVRGRLHGVPILVKDNIATGDRMRTTCGSLALDDCIASKDAHLITRLREQGLLILGKTNLSEWANFRSTRSTSGWSARGGLTRNPHCLDRSASGSSSGSAVAVAANYVALSIGTETDGSIISPSQANGIVGLKPTVGLISRHGIIPVALSQDTAGPMTRTVRDAALLLDVLAGADAADHTTTTAPQMRVSYTEHLRKDGLNRARIGIARELGEMPAVTRIMDGAIKTLRELGAEVIDPIVLPKHDDYEDDEDIVLESEFKAQLPQWFAEFAPDCKLSNLADVISWNAQHANREFTFFAQERFELAQQREDLSSQLYLDARAKCTQIARTEGIEKQLAEHRLDALVAPSGDPAWMIDLVHGDRSCFFFTSAAAVSGLPHLTVPTGFVHDLPVGLSFIGASWSESTLLRFGYAYEQATQARRSPKFKPTLNLDF